MQIFGKVICCLGIHCQGRACILLYSLYCRHGTLFQRCNKVINSRIKMMMQLEEWHWAPAALSFLAEHADAPERAKRFFQYLERFAFACELGVIENRVRERRFADAARMQAEDFETVFSERVLDLSDSERLKFIEQLNRSRQKDKSRRLLAIRLEAAMPGGSILSLREDATVEHVLPKNGGPAWTSTFPDPVLRKDAAHLLGNLVLVTLGKTTHP